MSLPFRERSFPGCTRRVPAFLSDEKEATSVINAAIEREPTGVIHCVARPGWQVDKDGTLRFSYGNKLIGAPVKNTVLACPFEVERRGPSGTVIKGSLQDWQRRVGVAAKKSPCATLLVAAAFAAPLLPFAEIMSFGLNIYGAAKKGKSLALTAGGSVIGLGLEENLLTWGTTIAGILEKAGAWTDLPLLINEVGTIKGKRKDAYQLLRELTFAFNAGHDTVRHSSWGASGDPFRLIYAASAEHSTSEYAAMAGEKRDDGELVRLVDFPAIVPTTDSIFAVLPKGVSAEDATSDFRLACRECSGTAFPPYLHYLTQFKKAELEAKARPIIKEFHGARAAGNHGRCHAPSRLAFWGSLPRRSNGGRGRGLALGKGRALVRDGVLLPRRQARNATARFTA